MFRGKAMKAFISDIHGNLEALKVVLNDIDSRNVDEILFLGDVVGYGPNPEECIDLVMERAQYSLMGNHDFALIHGSFGFNTIAAEVIQLTREMMQKHIEEEVECLQCPNKGPGEYPPCLTIKNLPEARWKFIEKLEKTYLDNNVLYFHGSPLDPVFEYVFPDNYGPGWKPERISKLMEKIPWLGFCGHTHFPCAISSDLKCYYPQQGDLHFFPDQELKHIINIGSVGQPRDDDPRACYLLFDEKEKAIEWRRLEYDIAAVAQKIEKMCGKGNRCAKRLWKGE